MRGPTRAPGPRPSARAAFAPGRVNLIGDHTDYTGGLCLPMAVHLGTTVTLEPGGRRLRLSSDAAGGHADIDLEAPDPGVGPAWARYVAAVVAELAPANGGVGTVATTLPLGAGLASSAALEVATALALGFSGSPLALARLCQRAEHRAVGVPSGLMDQLASALGVAGHALLLDCRTTTIEPVALPEGAEVVAVHCGVPRSLAASAYATRQAECQAAEAVVGPLRDVGPDDVSGIADPTLRRRARHVVTENRRVQAFADALVRGELRGAGALMAESHRSLRHDFEVSLPALDRLVDDLVARPGVFGARLTGGGFGGCVVALAEPGALDVGWRLRPVGGARPVEP